VEDVTGREAVLIVADSSPKLATHRWKGSGEPQEIGQKTTPWIFEKGDTTIVYRFTVQITGVPEPVIIYQPAVFPESAKKMLIMVARAKNG
jgi:hypothetical protein